MPSIVWDFFVIAGFGLLVVGLASIYVPLGWLFAGGSLLALGAWGAWGARRRR
jgi:hypothetical protein